MAILVFEHSDLSGSDRLGETLRDHGQRLQVIRAHRGDTVPAGLEGVDGIVSCGGPQDPTDETLDWMQAELDLLRAAHAAQLPVVGVCLGTQLLARALGGQLRRMPEGIEFGWQEVTLTPAGRDDPIHAGIAWKSMQFQHHRFEVHAPPDGARVLSGSQRCPVQSWALGQRTYGFQYHAEIFPETIDGWIADEPEVLDEAGIEREELARQTDIHYPAFARLAQRLFDSVALLLMPVDRRYQGLVKDLHH